MLEVHDKALVDKKELLSLIIKNSAILTNLSKNF